MNRKKLGACFTITVVVVSTVLALGVLNQAFFKQASQRPKKSKTFPKKLNAPENLNSNYAKQINQIVEQARNGSITWGEASSQIQQIVSKASRYETPPSEWHSPPSVSIGQGFGVGSADYIIFKGSEGNVYAKSGDNGQIMYEGDNASRVIQDVIDTKPNSILIREGRYIIDTSITITRHESNLTLSGIGSGTVLASPKGEVISDPLIWIKGADNTTVTSVFVDGGTNTDNGPEMGIEASWGANNFTIKNLIVRGAYSHNVRVAGTGTRNGIIRGVFSHLNGDDAIAIDHGRGVTVTNCAMWDGRSAGGDSSAVEVNDNAENVSISNIYAWNQSNLVSVHGHSDTEGCRDVSVQNGVGINCDVNVRSGGLSKTKNVTISGVVLKNGRIAVHTGVEDAVVSSCSVESGNIAAEGAALGPGGAVTITNNHVTGGFINGTDAQGRVVVDGNTIRDVDNAGIYFGGDVKYALVKNNLVENCSGNGIAGNIEIVKNNKILNAGKNGISGYQTLVKGNFVENVAEDGILQASDATAPVSIINNELKNENRFGIKINVENSVIRGNKIKDCGNDDYRDGIYCNTKDKVLITNNHISNCYGKAIEDVGTRCYISSNYFLNNSTGVYEAAIGISGSNNTILNNKFVALADFSHQRGISIKSGTGNVIKNNDLRCVWGPVFPEIANTNNIIEKNPGFVTENSGVEADAVPIDSTGLKTVTVNFSDFDNAPEVVNATLTNLDNENVVAYIVQTTNIGIGSFDLKVYVDTASATTGDNADVAWHAEDKTYG